MSRNPLIAAALAATLALAGCLAPGSGAPEPTGDDGGDLVVRVDGNRSAIAPGEHVGFRIVVENQGSENVTYRDGCLSAWTVALEGPDGETVEDRKPRGLCDGFQPRNLTPGEEVAYELDPGEHGYVWNGTVWTGSGYEDAEAGTYTLQVRFAFETDSNPSRVVTGSEKVDVEDSDDEDAPVRYEGLEITTESDRDAIAPGETVRVNATVENTGNRTVWYNDVCGWPWDADVVAEDGRSVNHTKHEAQCMALAWTTLEPGESISSKYRDPPSPFTWNGTEWNRSEDDEARYGNGSWEPVEEGDYTIRLTFRYAMEKNGDVRELPGSEHVEVSSEDDEGSGEVEAEASSSTDAIAPGETVYVNATATNVGDVPVEHRVGCGHAWSVTVTGPDGEEVQAHRPMASCLGFSWERLEPDASVPYPNPDGRSPWTWNGTVWNGSGYEEAEPGDYTVAFSFPWRDQGAEDARETSASVVVTVTEDG
jgi:hypothetical protein